MTRDADAIILLGETCIRHSKILKVILTKFHSLINNTNTKKMATLLYDFIHSISWKCRFKLNWVYWCVRKGVFEMIMTLQQWCFKCHWHYQESWENVRFIFINLETKLYKQRKPTQRISEQTDGLFELGIKLQLNKTTWRILLLQDDYKNGAKNVLIEGDPPVMVGPVANELENVQYECQSYELSGNSYHVLVSSLNSCNAYYLMP